MTNPIKEAGASKEANTERNGFLSYHAETHALVVGFAVGVLGGYRDSMALVALILPAITSGLRAKDKEFSKILTDLKQEPHYGLFGIAIGLIVGITLKSLM